MNTETNTTTIVEALSMDFVDMDGLSTPVAAELAYDAADPFAVSILFTAEPVPVRWTFARDLLIAGLYEPTGDGDVHVWPCLSPEGSAVVIVELNSPHGEVLVQVDSRAVAAFNDQMLAAVPAGSEGDHVDFDAELARLLAA